MKTFTKIYWGIWALALIFVIFIEINAKPGEGPGLMLFLYFGFTMFAIILYGAILLVARFLGKDK